MKFGFSLTVDSELALFSFFLSGDWTQLYHSQPGICTGAFTNWAIAGVKNQGQKDAYFIVSVASCLKN